MAARSKKDKLNLWTVEQYYHSDTMGESWGKPIKVCYSEKEAQDLIELESLLYAADFKDAVIDRSIKNMIIVKPNGEVSFTPSMDFWYYQSVLVEEEE